MTKRERDNSWAEIPMSRAAKNTTNPIRSIVDRIQGTPNPNYRPIKVSIGDPTLCGNFLPSAKGDEAVLAALKDCHSNGYGPAHGSTDARKAVAEKMSEGGSQCFTENDVIMCCGASGALDIAFNVLADAGDNVLFPNPGFSLYGTICDHAQIECRRYHCDPAKDWEADISHMRSLIDSRTKAILINNPSNPCGSVFSKKHLEAIVRVAEEFKVPIVSDEIYANMTFGVPFVSAVEVCGNVPCIVVGGIAKQFVVPGWRIGWAVLCDRAGVAKQIREGMFKLCTLILGPASLLQVAVRPLLHQTPQSYYDDMIRKLEEGARVSYEALRGVPGLSPTRPSGAMYMMVGIDIAMFRNIADDVDFCTKLWLEFAVQVLPGSCFGATNFFRVVFTNSHGDLKEAFGRIDAFCKAHLASSPAHKE